ncbi:hypothetical protein BD770DRAFT_383740 [Pilaira anomala]|nr:hypothetical protein BD770DRAFT_383740 [Pilaira anomala]
MSDFPPPATSAINPSKNRKKKNKKKNNKKQEDVVPSPPVEGVSYADAAAMPAEDESANSDDTSDVINDTDSRSGTNDQSQDDKHSAAPNLDTIPATGAPSFAEIAATSPSPSNDVDTHPEALSEVVKYSIQSVIASRCIHIDEIVAEISKKVKAGEYNTSAPVVSHKQNSPPAATSDPLPLSDAINTCINCAVGSGSMDLYSIVDRIAHKVKEGDYKASSPITNTTATTDKPKPTSSESAGPPSSFQLTEPIQSSIDSAIASRSIHLYAIVEDISRKVQSGEYDTKAHNEEHHRKSLKEVVTESTGAAAESTMAAVASAVAGTAHAISEKFTSVHPEKLSENVEHCIQSTINARSIDLEAILHHNKDKLKRPEAAVGETMPSSAKKADIVPPTPSKVNDVQAKQPTVPKKDTHLETHKPKISDHQQEQHQHKKKKDCIIL